MKFRHVTILEALRGKSVEYPSGISAFGLPVPAHRIQKAYEWLKDEMQFDRDVAHSISFKATGHVERDATVYIIGNPSSLHEDMAKLDLTGRYRLLAILTTD